MARFGSRELDRWATALGVTNDTDAMKVLSKTLVLIVAARTESAAVARSTPSAPDDTVYRSATMATNAFDVIAELILPVYVAFQRHSRGR
jgi:hypothetical protein